MAPRGRVSLACVALLLAAAPALASDSCCKKAAAVVTGDAHKQLVPNMDVEQPDDWDEEDDGVWERPMIMVAASPLQIFRKDILSSLLDACPWMLLGLISTALMQTFNPSTNSIRTHLTGRGAPVVMKGTTLGLVSPLCSCGTLPIAFGLVGAGAAPSAVVAFLVAAQSAGIDSLVFTFGVLGRNVALARLACAGVVALVAGAVTPGNLASKPNEQKESAEGGGSLPQRLASGFKSAATETFDELAPAVAIGFAVTSAVTSLLPPGGLARVALLGGIPGRGAVLALALPLSFCEHAAVPLAAALQRAGAGSGLSFAMLATLPGVNMATFGVIGGIAGKAGAARVAAVIWAAGLAGSYLGDYMGAEVVLVGHEDSGLPEWYQHASQYVMGAILVCAAVRLVLRLVSPKKSSCCSTDCGDGHSKTNGHSKAE